MTKPWLSIVGIGEDGLGGLNATARAAVESADVIVGGERHHRLTEAVSAERVTWPKPFDHLLDSLEAMRGRQVCVLVTGDPVWFSAGVKIAKHFTAGDVAIHPHVSAFQLACARMHWSLNEVETLSVHGRSLEDVQPYLAPGTKLALLTHNGETPAQMGRYLTQQGYGDSRMTVLGAMGGVNETRVDGFAKTWTADAPALHVLCLECVLDADQKLMPLGPGLPDDAFEHDGKMTKRDIRALTLAKIAPRPGELLWDIGAGCGSIGIEWMRSGRNMKAIGLEPNADRRAMAERNAAKLGATGFSLIDGEAPTALEGLEAPDAIFIGGGLSQATVDASMAALKAHGRLVANAVTLESEQLLISCHNLHGGELTRISVAQADAVGRYRGWRPAMPVTQWSLTT